MRISPKHPRSQSFIFSQQSNKFVLFKATCRLLINVGWNWKLEGNSNSSEIDTRITKCARCDSLDNRKNVISIEPISMAIFGGLLCIDCTETMKVSPPPKKQRPI